MHRMQRSQGSNPLWKMVLLRLQKRRVRQKRPTIRHPCPHRLMHRIPALRIPALPLWKMVLRCTHKMRRPALQKRRRILTCRPQGSGRIQHRAQPQHKV
jgi:hypothetical protein